MIFQDIMKFNIWRKFLKIEKESIFSAIKRILDGSGDLDIDELIEDISVKEGNIVVVLLAKNESNAEKLEPIRSKIQSGLKSLNGVASVTVVITAENKSRNSTDNKSSTNKNLKIKYIIAVASGKGGVGKSTVSVNTAMALSLEGFKVAILDADIYGPSLPRMMGISEKPRTNSLNKIVPVESFGVKCMSIGMVVDEEKPVIWRGPMVQGAIQQLIYDVEWETLDFLLIDLPPGTGDAQLTISQKIPQTGAILETTPQDIALLDARKGLNMFRQVDVPITGMIENMSFYICPKCGNEDHLFSHNGAKNTADKMGVEFLGAIPLHSSIRECSDIGHPIVISKPESIETTAFKNIAKKIISTLDKSKASLLPEITIT